MNQEQFLTQQRILTQIRDILFFIGAMVAGEVIFRVIH